MMNKTLIILASYSIPSQLEKDISDQTDVELLKWSGIPKSLLPLSKKSSLGWFLEHFDTYVPEIYIISNAYNDKYYERWASEYGFPRENIINCGLSSGALGDLAFLNRVKPCQKDTVIVLSDILCKKEDVMPIISGMNQYPNQIIYGRSQNKNDIPLAFCLSLNNIQSLENMVESKTSTTTFQQISVKDMDDQLFNYIQSKNDSTILTIKTSSHYEYLDYRLTLSDYLHHWKSIFDQEEKKEKELVTSLSEIIRKKAYARVGLIGNPSDGFYGKTMSLLISNFWAEVTLIPNNYKNQHHYQASNQPLSSIQIISNPMADMQQFNSLSSLINICEQNGYNNADRLFLATCKVFYQYCQQENIPINTTIGFKLLFNTNIPRQVGLAGSSAIITAFWKCLFSFYQLSDHCHATSLLTLERQASLILSVEVDELGIAAGLQDRVIQSFGGLVFMDFEKSFMDQHGYGQYTVLDEHLLPPLYLAYVAHPEDSGKVHSSVKQRFLSGDNEIIEAMKQFAQLTEKSIQALKEKDYSLFGSLMTQNFELRRKTYGDRVVGEKNLRMVEIVRKHGGHAKFSGSGGAIVILLNDFTLKEIQHLAWDLEKEGYVFLKLIPKGSQLDQQK